MQVGIDILVGLVCAVLGFGAAFLLGRTREAEARVRMDETASRLKEAAERVTSLEGQLADSQASAAQWELDAKGLQTKLDERDASYETRLNDLRRNEEEIRETFAVLSQQVLDASTAKLAEQAKTILDLHRETADSDLGKRQRAIEDLVTPVRDNLKKLEEFNRDIEEKRNHSYGHLLAQVREMSEQQVSLRGETQKLIKALQDPGTSGQWGEMVLQRVIELAGMNERVDFDQQVTQDGDEGRQRPDAVVHMPGGRRLVIDSKASMRAYLDSLEATDDAARQALLIEHAAKMVGRIKELKRKDYTARDQDAPDFTVMFVPSESAFRAALEVRPQLMEEAMEGNVVMASPTNLLGLLRAIAYGWRQERLAENARAIQADAGKLYDSLCVLLDHYAKIGKGLTTATEAYNKFAGSLNLRVVPAGQRLKEMGMESSKALVELEPVAFHPTALRTQGIASLPGFEGEGEEC